MRPTQILAAVLIKNAQAAGSGVAGQVLGAGVRFLRNPVGNVSRAVRGVRQAAKTVAPNVKAMAGAPAAAAQPNQPYWKTPQFQAQMAARRQTPQYKQMLAKNYAVNNAQAKAPDELQPYMPNAAAPATAAALGKPAAPASAPTTPAAPAAPATAAALGKPAAPASAPTTPAAPAAPAAPAPAKNA